MSLGFKQAGCEILASVDNDSWAVKTHYGNFPECRYSGNPIDISITSPRDLHLKKGDIDILIGSPPCQGFSAASQAKLRSLSTKDKWEKTNNLYREFVRFLTYLQPTFFVMENVPGLLSFERGKFFEQLSTDLTSAGYDIESRILNACDYGVPQRRKRLFILGKQKKRNDLNIIFPSKSADSIVSVRSAISDLCELKAIIADFEPSSKRRSSLRLPDTPKLYSKQSELSKFQKAMRHESGEFVLNHSCRTHNQLDIDIFKQMGQGAKFTDIPKSDRRYRSDIFKDKYRRLIESEPAWTITAHLQKDGLSFIHYNQDRSISAREAARLQSFPDNFVFSGPLTKVFRQIGNAVPPLMAQRVAEGLINQI